MLRIKCSFLPKVLVVRNIVCQKLGKKSELFHKKLVLLNNILYFCSDLLSTIL